jgi:hypothetical protein
MTRHLVIFFACFLLGAIITAAVRTMLYRPYAGQAATAAATPPAAPPVAAAAPAPAATSTPINTICAICSMPVDPKIPTAQYRGSTIGFGCKMCPPKFAADPEKYGPAFLANRVIEE